MKCLSQLITFDSAPINLLVFSITPLPDFFCQIQWDVRLKQLITAVISVGDELLIMFRKTFFS